VKKILTLTAMMCLLLSVGSVFAQGPYLTCSPFEETEGYGLPTHFVVLMNAQTYEVPAEWTVDNKPYLKFDLDGLWVEGPNYIQEVRAANFWGVSDPVPFSFAALPPYTPEGLDVGNDPHATP